MIRLQIVTEQWNPISMAIRYSTRSWASHAEFIDLSLGNALAETLGARSNGGVKIRPGCIDHYSRIEQFTAPKIEEAYRWALTQSGKKYDYSAISGIAFDRNWRDPRKWFCSELVAAAFEAVEAPILSTRPSSQTWRVTPRDLLLSRQLVWLATYGLPIASHRVASGKPLASYG